MRKDIYIRKEDQAIWESIVDKPRFIHDALRAVNPETYNKAVVERKQIEHIMEPFTEALKRANNGKEYNFCKHDQIKGLCKKGCK